MTLTTSRPAAANLPRTTEIIRAAGLMPEYTNEAAREKGTAVHLALAYYDKGTLDRETLDPAIEPYLVQYEKFLQMQQVGIIEIEKHFRHEPFGYQGTLDRLATLHGRPDTVWVLDFKTGGPANWHGIQLAAYAIGAELPHARRANVYLSPTGAKLEVQNEPSDYIDFRAALRIYQRRKQWNLLS